MITSKINKLQLVLLNIYNNYLVMKEEYQIGKASKQKRNDDGEEWTGRCSQENVTTRAA